MVSFALDRMRRNAGYQIFQDMRIHYQLWQFVWLINESSLAKLIRCEEHLSELFVPISFLGLEFNLVHRSLSINHRVEVVVKQLRSFNWKPGSIWIRGLIIRRFMTLCERFYEILIYGRVRRRKKKRWMEWQIREVLGFKLGVDLNLHGVSIYDFIKKGCSFYVLLFKLVRFCF